MKLSKCDIKYLSIGMKVYIRYRGEICNIVSIEDNMILLNSKMNYGYNDITWYNDTYIKSKELLIKKIII